MFGRTFTYLSLILFRCIRQQYNHRQSETSYSSWKQALLNVLCGLQKVPHSAQSDASIPVMGIATSSSSEWFFLQPQAVNMCWSVFCGMSGEITVDMASSVSGLVSPPRDSVLGTLDVLILPNPCRCQPILFLEMVSLELHFANSLPGVTTGSL